MSQYLNEKGVQAALIAYAVKALATWAREDATPVLQKIKQERTIELSLISYLALLQVQDSSRKEKEGEFTTLLSLLAPKEGAKAITPKSLTARPLSLDLATLSGSNDKSGQLWTKFKSEFEKLPDNEWRFEAFSHLFYKYAWSVPCTYGEIGVSLYEEFKAISAMMYASGLTTEPAEQFLLVGGDLSGIQKFIYTVTHKAAARGLRGRSFFLQLLSDAIVRAILRELKLPRTNLVYDAGGTFLILVPNGAEMHLKPLVSHFNDTLLKTTEGDLRVIIGWHPIAREAVGNPDAWRTSIKKMYEAKSSSKKRPFSKLAYQNWKMVFQPLDEGGERYCAICHRGLKDGEGKELDSEGDEKETICGLCDSLSQLATHIGGVAKDGYHKTLWMVVQPQIEQDAKGELWANLLIQLAQFRYDFVNDMQKLPNLEQAIIYTLNEPDFLQAKAHGFRLLANVTPRMTSEDVKWAKQKKESGHIYYQGDPMEDHIRDLDVMARDGQGVKWVGVLRMDVDNLGAVISQWQPARALTGTSALSNAMDFFFSGQLNKIVRDVALVKKKDEKERLAAYIIYGGGDDLFIVGAWDKLATLAERIQAEFYEYTGKNPNLTISAGISLMDRPKFPLYLAAKQAKAALDDKAKAKRWELGQENGRIFEKPNSKNAVCFLDTVVGWERWLSIKGVQAELVNLCNEGVPRALIQTVKGIYTQYERGRKDYEEKHGRQERTATEIRTYPMFHGRWMWMTAYTLFRMAHRYLGRAPQLEERLEKLQQTILDPKITPYLGLAARWSEYLTRKQPNDLDEV